MNRMLMSSLLAIIVATLSIAAQGKPSRVAAPPHFELIEATIPQMQAAMKDATCRRRCAASPPSRS